MKQCVLLNYKNLKILFLIKVRIHIEKDSSIETFNPVYKSILEKKNDHVCISMTVCRDVKNGLKKYGELLRFR